MNLDYVSMDTAGEQNMWCRVGFGREIEILKKKLRKQKNEQGGKIRVRNVSLMILTNLQL